jgi:glutamate/tyrosine decarboxylase-like PLP-dependent enzyme
VPTWAVLKTLGRSGLVDLIERTAHHARRFAGRLEAAGFEILNEVVLNQVLIGCVDQAAADRLAYLIREDGTLFAGPTVWQDRAAIRISVSSWKTTEADIDRSAEAIVRLAAAGS